MIDIASLYPDLDSIIDSQLISLSAAPPNELGPLCEELCVFYRSTGIGAILLELDIDRFHHMLIRSGLTRVYLLQKTAPTDKDESRFCKITRANGFFDSLAANRFDIAERIAALSPQKWNEKYEYEDDYCYILFLHKMIEQETKAVKESILQRFEKILEGQPSPKYDICCTLLEGNTESFEDAFINLLDHRTEELEFQEKSISRHEVEFATGRHVYIEGLALLRIAEMVGIQTKEEYPYCPKEAREPMQSPFPNTGYPK